MEIRGWDDHPRDFQIDFNFDKGPKWLLLLSHIPFLEKYAYPKAIDLGLAEAWPVAEGKIMDPNFNSKDWIVHKNPKNDLEKWIEGSLALLHQGRSNPRAHFFLAQRNIQVNNRVVFWHVIPRFSLTRYGTKMRLRHDVHRMNGTFKEYKQALKGEHFDFSG